MERNSPPQGICAIFGAGGEKVGNKFVGSGTIPL